MAVATPTRRTTRTRRTTAAARTLPTTARRAGCDCLDLPRMHARGDSGCSYEGDIAIAAPSAAVLERRAARAAQARSFTEALGTDLSETR